MENENDRSSGVRGNSPNFTYLKSQEYITTDNFGFLEFYTCNSVFIVSYTTQPLTYTQGSSVGYREVSILSGINGKHGKTIKKYTSQFDYPDWTFLGLPTTQPVSNDFNRGLLKEEKIYSNVNNTFKIIKSDTNTYELGYTGKTIPAVNIGYIVENVTQNLSTFSEHQYHYRERWNNLVSNETRVYQNSDNYVNQHSTFFYDTPDHFQIIKKQANNSNGQVIETNYKYPQDYTSPSGVISTMISKNMIGLPIEKIQKVDGQVVFATGTGFEHNITDDIVLPKNIFSYETSTSGIDFYESIDGSTFSAYSKKVTYYKYDSKGNILEFSKEENMHTCYIWSYNQSYPIAKIENASYTEIETAVSNLGTGFLNGLAIELNQAIIDTKLSSLRLEVTNKLPNALITTFTYKPGVGVSSQTDSNGLTMIFNYDDFGRLRAIVDNNGKIVKEIIYHYKK